MGLTRFVFQHAGVPAVCVMAAASSGVAVSSSKIQSAFPSIVRSSVSATVVVHDFLRSSDPGEPPHAAEAPPTPASRCWGYCGTNCFGFVQLPSIAIPRKRLSDRCSRKCWAFEPRQLVGNVSCSGWRWDVLVGGRGHASIKSRVAPSVEHSVVPHPCWAGPSFVGAEFANS